MLRSLFSGISGLRAHQTMMDVTGNNIANVNTAGFKSSSTVFEDTLSQMLKAAGAPQAGNGGTNPAQVGLGVRLAAINTNFGQGAAQNTGRATDMMVQGDGFFVVASGGQQMYTRAGAFSFDTTGKLTTPEGAVVQGWMATGGVIDSNGPVGDIVLPIGTTTAPSATDASTVAGNLKADAPVYNSADPTTAAGHVTTSIDMYDEIGNKHTVMFDFQKTGANAWALATAVDGGALSAPTSLDFTGGATWPAGTLDPATTFTVTFGTTTVDVSLTSLTQFGGETSASATDANGSPSGTLNAFTISPDGTIVGVFSNGMKESLGQIALANFNNPPGLEKVGGSLYRTTVNSGVALLGAANTGGRGLLSSGALEMSNVDLAAEFTNLIVAERGFQANSRVITTSDEILQDLVNLKR